MWIYSYQHTVRKYTTQREIISKIDLTGFSLRNLVGKNKSTLATNTVMRYFILHTAFMDRKSTLKKQRGRY
jgi:hypothetical protein